MISPRTKAILAPNLIGNAPDWDRIRAIADAHGLKVIEDSCDALGSTLRGTPTGTRSDISVTSFALAHIITAAGDRRDGAARRRRARSTAACCCAGGVDARSRSSTAPRRATRASSPRSTASSTTTCSSSTRSGWNFEPCEISRRVRARAARQAAGEPRASPAQLRPAVERSSAPTPTCSRLPRTARGARDRVAHVPDHAPTRVGHPPGRLPGAHGGVTASTPAWCGRATSPASPRSPRCRTASRRAGCPMPTGSWSRGSILPSNHGLDDDDVEYLCVTAGRFLQEHGFAPAGVAS